MSDFIIIDGELYHHGVKGMKWGVRKQKREQKKWNKNVIRNWHNAYNSASRKINAKLDDFNSKYSDNQLKDPKKRAEYAKRYAEMWNRMYEKELISSFGRPVIDDGREWCERVFGFLDAGDVLDSLES